MQINHCPKVEHSDDDFTSIKRYKSFVAVLLWMTVLMTSLTYASEDLHHFTTKSDELRYQTLIQQTRCVVCQGQNIADSNAPLATDLREKIFQMIHDKKSNEEIKNYLTKRYGEFILYQPRWNKLTYFLWAFPFISLLTLLGFLFSYALPKRRVS